MQPGATFPLLPPSHAPPPGLALGQSLGASSRPQPVSLTLSNTATAVGGLGLYTDEI